MLELSFCFTQVYLGIVIAPVIFVFFHVMVIMLNYKINVEKYWLSLQLYGTEILLALLMIELYQMVLFQRKMHPAS